MATVKKDNYQNDFIEQKEEIRNMVLAGLQQVKMGNTMDFDAVCDRLEEKYRSEALQN